MECQITIRVELTRNGVRLKRKRPECTAWFEGEYEHVIAEASGFLHSEIYTAITKEEKQG